MWNALCDFLASIIGLINGVVGNYGVSIILFTILIKGCLTPLDLKSRRSMRRMAAINPKMEALKKKYANDQQKLNQKIQELYKEEKISPLAGCLPMLLTMPILFAMFTAMRNVANIELVKQYLQMIHGRVPATEAFLWIRNLWMPDSFAAPVMPDFNSLRAIGQEVWVRVSQDLVNAGTLAPDTLLAFADKAAFDAFIAGIQNAITTAPNYVAYLQPVPGWQNVSMLLFSFSVFVKNNGYFVLPLFATASQYLSQKLMTPTTGAPAAAADPSANPSAATGKTMMMLMPLMSLFFCATSSSAFAIYWVASALVATAQQVAFNRYFTWEEKKSAIAGEVGIK
ncbi:MAG: YidC/Oxa1 family membrane protein insertase [Oscillospiraceae bacterium]|jgi:YidC/Oxa1 family membrane protein insertase|nr:YidC/Oxa1 family membrane protein insertase [Oscillospiraceae bacterium]